MRWTGLRISDAVVLTLDKIEDGVLRVGGFHITSVQHFNSY